MKKLLVLCFCFSLSFTITGCSLGSLIDRFSAVEDTPQEEAVADKPRVYMDEVRGELEDFTGNQLTVRSDETSYVFDISQATLECEGGMITGDEISIIYEGQLNANDTTNVKALKVVDEFHKKQQLEDKTIRGQIQALTANTITLKDESGKTATYPIVGTEQYYQGGVSANAWVYLHYKGNFSETAGDNPAVLNAAHLKVLTVSDTEPLNVPAPTPTPPPSEDSEDQNREQKMQAIVQNVSLNILQVQVPNSSTVLNLNMSAVPCYFKGGAAPGSYVTIVYQGEFNGSTTEGIQLLGITGQDPEAMKPRNMTFTVSGTIVGSTANTITLQTADGALVTCNTTDAQLLTTGGLLSGSSVRVTFNPAVSRSSNIYSCIRIEDL